MVVLEPISVENKHIGANNEMLEFAREDADGKVHRIGGSDGGTQGQGTIAAYAIDAATLGTTNVRVGILTIALTQYANNDENYFATGCDMGVDDTATLPCLDEVIRADYEPSGDDAVGHPITYASWIADPENDPADYPIAGFLYWYRLTGDDAKPFNYTDVPTD